MTNLADRVQIDSLAMYPWLTTPEADRNSIIKRLHELAKLGPDEWHEPEVRPIRHLPGVYLLEAQDDFRVVFRREDDGKLTIRDIMIQALIDLFTSKPVEAAS